MRDEPDAYLHRRWWFEPAPRRHDDKHHARYRALRPDRYAEVLVSFEGLVILADALGMKETVEPVLAEQLRTMAVPREGSEVRSVRIEWCKPEEDS
jgi:hypothetical protein